MRVSYPVCACNLISRIPGCVSWEQTSDPSEVRALVPFLFVQGGLTPLHLAAIHGHVPVLLALLKHPKIDVNAEDNVRKGAGHELRNMYITSSNPHSRPASVLFRMAALRFVQWHDQLFGSSFQLLKPF